jgi:drug/metabolite transporter (DMT)-like permease
MSYAGAVPAALSLNLEPVASMFFGFVILGQTLSALQISGAALVIAAVLSVRLADIRKPGYQGEPLS